MKRRTVLKGGALLGGIVGGFTAHFSPLWAALPTFPSASTPSTATTVAGQGATSAGRTNASTTGPSCPAGEVPGRTFEVIVVGSGTAGLCAAIAAREAGAKRVAIVEKHALVGGHAIVSSGSVSVAFRHPDGKTPTEVERDLLMMKTEMRKAGGSAANPALIDALVDDSESAVRWLSDLGVHWDKRVFRAVGSVSARNISTGSPQAGYDYVQVLMRRAHELGVTFLMSTRAMGLVMHEGKVVGLDVMPMRNPVEAAAMPVAVKVLPDAPAATMTRLYAPAVVLATGGFTANVAMRSAWDPTIEESLPTTANPNHALLDGATGDGIVMAEQVGAALTGMEYIQVIPFSGGRLLDYVGGEIWISDKGQRIVSEGTPFRELRQELTKDDSRGFWAVSDSQTRKGASLGIKLMEGTVKQAETLEELARGIQVPVEVLLRTIARWNESVASGHDLDFGTSLTGTSIQVPPFFYGRETWSVHFTCGGIAINPVAEVLTAQGDVIPGLYAAGETTGGVHGMDRLGGNSMTDTFVFGRRAGRSAAGYALNANRCGTL